MLLNWCTMPVRKPVTTRAVSKISNCRKKKGQKWHNITITDRLSNVHAFVHCALNNIHPQLEIN